MKTLQENLRQKLQEHNLSASALEKRDKYTHQSIQNIIFGRSTNPGILLLTKIANSLNCSIDDLLGNSQTQSTKSNITDPALLINTLKYVIDILIQKNLPLDIDKIQYFTKETYLFLEKKSTKKIDKEFIKWFIEKNIDNL